MSYKSYKIKSFVKTFNFPSPDWENLPVDFPNLPTINLTKEEKCLLDAIKLAWLTETAEGRKSLGKKVAKTSVFAGICLISLISLIGLIQQTLTGSQSLLTRPVNAATVSAALKTNLEEIYESTMSAIFKK